MKKIISLMLTLVMVLAMSATTFAAGSGSITVENPIAGQTYTAYKIFDVVYNDNQTAYSYTIDSDSAWLATVQGYAGVDLSEMVTDSDKNNFYVVTMNDEFSAPAFAVALKKADVTTGGTELAVSGEKATATGLDLGYYFVTSTNGALCNLTTTTPSASIRDKNDVPFEKTADDASVELGQVVNYTINAAVPDTTGFTTYVYKITDTMSDGLTFNENVTVTIGSETVDVTPVYSGNGFELSIPMLDNDGNAIYESGTAIVVRYSATVNENAVAQTETNKAVLEYSNDPTDSIKTTKTPGEIVEVYSAEIVIDKYDSDATGTKLAGAQFVLYKTENETEYYYNLTNGVVTWVSTQDEATVVTTSEDGAAEFEGLEDGTYYLKEIEAPAGYNMLDEPVEVTINGAAEGAALSVGADVPNSTGTILPETGGIGTTIFYVIGGLLIAGAAVLLITRKRMSYEA